MRKFLFTCCALIAANSLLSQQNFWTRTDQTLLNSKLFEKKLKPSAFFAYQLKNQLLSAEVKKAPSEKSVNVLHSSFIISVPNPKGEMERFKVVESPVMDTKLSARYPGISSYSGKGIDRPQSTIRFSIGLGNFQAMILSTDRPTYYIDLLDEKTQQYIVFARPDMYNYKNEFKCLTEDKIKTGKTNASVSLENANDGTLRTYRMAMASTGEFSQFWLNGTETTDVQRKAKVLAALNSAMTRTNGIYERDFGIRMVLVANNDQIIYLDPNTDPWTFDLNGTTQTTIDNVIGDANYDIGHLVHRDDDNGNAGCIGCICVAGEKGSAFTSYLDLNNFDWFVVDYLTHEIGHQFGGNHTFTFNNESTIAQVEPGSGSTIMGYAGITGATNDVQPHSDDYFHAISIQQITEYTRVDLGNGCAVITNTGNAVPTVNAGADYIIPISTPFTLTGSGSDANVSDVLTYCWEQNNIRSSGFSVVPSTTATAGPQFRSFLPNNSLSRTFPQLEYILTGDNGWKWERLPAVNRTLNFRFTVRDNRAGGGNNVSDNMVLTVTGTSGPFLITSQNSAASWNAGTSQTITWSVNNTTAAPVSCANVAIELSLNGGLTFPIVLAATTANDGTETVTVPGNATTQARIRVRAIGNVFFDINNANITIVAPTTPSFDFITTTPATVACNGVTSSVINLGTTSILGYNTPITLSALAGVPAGCSVNFATNPVAPGNSVNVTLTNANSLTPGNYDITIQGISGGITKTTVLRYTVQTGVGPTINTNPVSQTSCEAANITFTSAATGAVSQQWQVSTDGGVNWVNLSGQTSTSLTLTNITSSLNNNRYRCVYSGQCNSSNTTAAILTVQAAPVISDQPLDKDVCENTNAQFSITVSGTNVSYQWQLSTDGGNNWADISAATSSQLTVNNVTITQNNHRYRCIVKGDCVAAFNSNAAVLNVSSPVIINAQPANVALCGTGDATFNVRAQNTNNGYQWQLSTDGGNVFSNINGSINQNINLNVTSLNFNNNRYRVVINNGVCPVVTSNAALLSVNPIPVVTLTAAPFTKLFPGLQTTVTANITPAGGVAVWEKNGTIFTNNSNSLNLDVDQLGTYKVTVTGAGGCVGESNLLNILDSATSRIFFYPNPNQGQFVVRYNNPQGTETQTYIRIFDARGAKVYEQYYGLFAPYSQMQVDLRATGSGIYLVELMDSKGKRLATGRVLVR